MTPRVTHTRFPATLLGLIFVTLLAALHADTALPIPTSEVIARDVVDLAAPGAELVPVPSNPNLVTVNRAKEGTALEVNIAPGPVTYPGITYALKPGAMDLSSFGYIEAFVTNTGTIALNVTLRIDSAASGERAAGTGAGSTHLAPGKSGVARVYFAKPGKGSGPIQPALLKQLLLFIGKNASEARSFRLESITAGGTPGALPAINRELVRNQPPAGVILGGTEKTQADKQFVAREGATASLVRTAPGASFNATFTGRPGQSILFRPIEGFWDLGNFLQVRVRVKNTGAAPASPILQLTSRVGRSDFGLAERPLAPGTTAEFVIPFIPRTPFAIVSDPEQSVLEVKKGWGVKDTPGATFVSHQTNGLLITSSDESRPASFEVLSIVAELPASPAAPAWLGQRPPVPGDWVKTFEDNFDGSTLDLSKWSPHGSNFWDKRVHFTRDNVLLGDGVARLRLEKKAGRHNDSPDGALTEFATGWLESYGKWKQLYGYFEVRVKLPTAPSMFPAFWLMPERGPSEWPKHRRTDTKDGAMEIDVFEGQSIWGPYRTTFGAHFDGYVKYHKTAGTSVHYNQPDAQGFLTIGLLWTPGHISVFSLGRKQGSWDSPRVSSVPSYLIFDLLPGGFEYDPLDPATLPADLIIDYVRVWQRRDLLAPAVPAAAK